MPPRLPATLFLTVVLPPGPALAAPANTLDELWAELGACLRGSGPKDGWELTVVFTVKRDGELFGKPRLTYSKLPPDANKQKQIAENVAKALNGCLPLSITDGLGGAIAGRPLAIRLVGRTPDQGI